MQDGAFVLHLKMAHTPLKVPDDCMRMCMHGFRFFFEDKTSFQNLNIKGEIRKGQVPGITLQSYPEVQCTERCP